MRAVKTIVATAVIVFALTTVAVAGVQHLTKTPSSAAAGSAPAQYTVTLTAEQFAQLMGQGKAAAATRTVHRTRHSGRRHESARRLSSASPTRGADRTSGRSYSDDATHGSYRCDGQSHRGDCWGHGSGGPHSGGGCW